MGSGVAEEQDRGIKQPERDSVPSGTERASQSGKGKQKQRFSGKHKIEVVLRILRG